MEEEESQDTNVAAKVVCAVVLAAIVVAAGVGLLIQHRKLDELRKVRADLEKSNWQLSVGREELVSANGKLADELRQLREALSSDRRKTVVHGWTRLGILEMTRKRT